MRTVFYHGKGATKKAALASALGEYFEVCLPTTFLLTSGWAKPSPTVIRALSQRKMVPTDRKRRCTKGLLDDRLRAFYDPENELTGAC